MKKVHIISHSHWDREWYMDYEQHHMLLIELIDDLIQLFKDDPEYKSFHLDGQTIILDDYLQVRPENTKIIKKLVKQGKLKVGPFYILQDDFLTTSESNARNMLLGAIDSKKWTEDYVKLGYFPDTFGNMGQTPQMMKQIGIDTAAFGRGVKPTGFGNQVFDNDKYSSNFSEMHWEGPDKSKVLGVLFANWYSNGKEIPVDKNEAKIYWDKKINDVDKYASTNQLLFLNGSDHQPVQKDLTLAIKVANELYPDIEFVHSDFNTYIKELKSKLPDNLNTITGELTSQETDGWTTLANTASSRIYLKQENVKASKMLEEVAEPLAVFASELGLEYPKDQLDYAWKTLMQNHPHDSICGCSVDEVHQEMMTRFSKSEGVAEYVANRSISKLEQSIDTKQLGEDANSKPFIIFNTGSSPKSGLTEIEVAYDKVLFTQSHQSAPDAFTKLDSNQENNFSVFDKNGQEIPIFNVSTRVGFSFELPKNSFRESYMNKFVKFSINVKEMKSYSWETYKLSLNKSKLRKIDHNLAISKNKIENDKLKIQINYDGSLNVLNKATNENFENLLIFEDSGDLGNEYVFREPVNDKRISTKNVEADITILENNSEFVKIKVAHRMNVPVSMNERLLEEQRSHTDYRQRKAGRSKEKKILIVTSILSLTKESSVIDIKTEFNNQMMDHRLQVLINTNKKVDKHYADSIYEVVERQNKVSNKWKNPENPQHTHAFVNVHDKKGGVTVSNIGLNEYEVTQLGEQIKVTLLRSIGELGDWGYFPTPDAQCLGIQSVSYAIDFHNNDEFYESLHRAFSRQIPFRTVISSYHSGVNPSTKSFVNINNSRVKITALKKSQASNENILRFYNLDSENQNYELSGTNKKITDSNILEEHLGETQEMNLTGYEIKTLLI